MISNATIKENYFACLQNIETAQKKANRAIGSVKLVVVTKGQNPEKIQEVIDAGARILGENYPEETSKKRLLLKDKDVEWHMIGHIQSRKVKYLVDFFSEIHSVESLETAKKLDEKFLLNGRTIPVLYEVNVSGEETKQGIQAVDESKWPAVIKLFEQLIQLKGIKCSGLMTMPPLSTNPEDSRKYFQKLRKLSVVLSEKLGEEYFPELSMGTSFDYEIAIQEGATFIRVGEAIMGPRVYTKNRI